MSSVNVTEEQVREILLAFRGATPVTIVAETVPAMRKTGNPFVGRVTKTSRVNGMIGWSYDHAVNAQLLREFGPEAEPFRAFPRKWGVRIEGTPLVEHKGGYYLEIKVERSLAHEYRIDGIPVPDSTLSPYLSKPSHEGSRQGVERPVVLRDYSLRNIRSLRMMGTEYLIG